MRASSKNVAGYSDWTKVEEFRTLSNEPPNLATGSVEVLSLAQVLYIAMAVLFLNKDLSFQPFSSITKLYRHL